MFGLRVETTLAWRDLCWGRCVGRLERVVEGVVCEVAVVLVVVVAVVGWVREEEREGLWC